MFTSLQVSVGGVFAQQGTNPGVTPNTTGLPGLGLVRDLVEGLVVGALVVALAGLVVSAVVWFVSAEAGSSTGVRRGRAGVVAWAAAAVLIAAARRLL